MKFKHLLLALMATLATSSFAVDKLVANIADLGVVEKFMDQSDGSWTRRVSSGGNLDASLITGTAATTTQTGADQVNFSGSGVKVVLNTTVIGTGSVTVTIQGKDVASGTYYTILAGAAVTTNATTVYTIHPGIASVANVSANDFLPRTWRVLVTANNVNPATYTVGASVVL